MDITYITDSHESAKMVPYPVGALLKSYTPVSAVYNQLQFRTYMEKVDLHNYRRQYERQIALAKEISTLRSREGINFLKSL
jgi:hypothetical protein